MKILLVDTDYPDYFTALYEANPNLTSQSYDAQWLKRTQSLCGVADYYSRHLSAFGWEAREIFANHPHLQRAWARERGLKLSPETSWSVTLRRGVVPWLRKRRHTEWLSEVLVAQAKETRPDVFYNHALADIPVEVIARIRPYVGAVVGQIASPIPEGQDWSLYDLVLSSLPNLVARFQSLGVKAKYFPLGFESSILQIVAERERTIPLSFVGSLTPIHRHRVELLTWLCERVPLQIWGQGAELFPADHPLRRCHQGRAVGRQMYEILASSRLTLNSHLDLAAEYANNMRLFEATGMGALLITDDKTNLRDLFEPGTEIVAYQDRESCLRLIEHFLADEAQAKSIATRGQQRTLGDHSYARRMSQLDAILRTELTGRGKAETPPLSPENQLGGSVSS